MTLIHKEMHAIGQRELRNSILKPQDGVVRGLSRYMLRTDKAIHCNPYTVSMLNVYYRVRMSA
jgi:hypothetical protein